MEAVEIRFPRKSFLPKQLPFFECKAKIHAYVGGYGAGKTHVFLRKCLWCLIELKNRKGRSNGRVIYPTFDLAEELFVGPFSDLLDTAGIHYTYNISKHLFKTSIGDVRIFQLQTPKRIVGSELTWAGFDEFDVESWKNCHTAFMKTIGRMRGCDNWQMFFVSTPEGTHYLHKVFVDDNKNKDRVLFKARTQDNPHNPEGYVEDLERNYDERMILAYRDGEFVNLTQGTVYHAFGKHNIKPVTLDTRLPLVVMCDFNRGAKPMCWNVGQVQGDTLLIKYAFHKNYTDTYQMCEYLESELYRLLKIKDDDRLPALNWYGDYSGNKETSNSQKTDWEIIENHFANKSVRNATYTRPTSSVRDGVNAVNSMLKNARGESRLFVDPEAEHLIRDYELTVWDGSGMREDQSNDERSHAVSAVRYFVDYEFPMRARIKRF
jgi:hypothetical protein